MSYREKIAWLSIIGMICTYGPYFVLLSVQYLPNEADLKINQLSTFAFVAIAHMLITIIGHAVLRKLSHEEANEPADERDQAIMNLSTKWAYYCLLVGMVLVGVIMPFGSSGWPIINAALFMIVVAEMIHEGVKVYCYRRDS